MQSEREREREREREAEERSICPASWPSARVLTLCNPAAPAGGGEGGGGGGRSETRDGLHQTTTNANIVCASVPYPSVGGLATVGGRGLLFGERF